MWVILFIYLYAVQINYIFSIVHIMNIMSFDSVSIITWHIDKRQILSL